MLSVIVSTYNKPDHLERVLAGLGRQVDVEFEIVVADDGSQPETAARIDAFARSTDVHVEHVWQEDDGFRAARIRNLGVRRSRGDIIVFLDGDCIPFPHFLAAHEKATAPDRILAGDRLFLDREPSEALSVEQVDSGEFERILPDSEYKALRRRAFKDRIYRATRLKERPKIVTANVSMPREAFESVNGLDERFVGWGHEDEDLRRRFVAQGYRIEPVTTTALVCHLWHPHVDSFRGRVRDGDNVPYYERGFYLSRCRFGLSERRLEECRIAWGGVEPSGGRAELSITSGTGTTAADAEIRVHVSTESSPPPRGTHIWIVTASREPTGKISGPTKQAAMRVAFDGPIDLSTTAGRAATLRILEPIV